MLLSNPANKPPISTEVKQALNSPESSSATPASLSANKTELSLNEKMKIAADALLKAKSQGIIADKEKASLDTQKAYLEKHLSLAGPARVAGPAPSTAPAKAPVRSTASLSVIKTKSLTPRDIKNNEALIQENLIIKKSIKIAIDALKKNMEKETDALKKAELQEMIVKAEKKILYFDTHIDQLNIEISIDLLQNNISYWKKSMEIEAYASKKPELQKMIVKAEKKKALLDTKYADLRKRSHDIYHDAYLSNAAIVEVPVRPTASLSANTKFTKEKASINDSVRIKIDALKKNMEKETDALKKAKLQEMIVNEEKKILYFNTEIAKIKKKEKIDDLQREIDVLKKNMEKETNALLKDKLQEIIADKEKEKASLDTQNAYLEKHLSLVAPAPAAGPAPVLAPAKAPVRSTAPAAARPPKPKYLGGFYEKYLKYKTKYLQLKAELNV